MTRHEPLYRVVAVCIHIINALAAITALVSLAFLAAACRTTPTNTGPPCLIDTPTQRAIWDKMKAENSVGYQQIKANTTINRYSDLGRWEMLAAVIDRDAALALKSFEELKVDTKAWTVIWKGNESREHTIELAIRYGCLHPYLNDTQRTEYRQYMVKVADGIIAGLRPNDSDQVTGNFFGLALIDRVLGTNYLDGNYTDPGQSATLNPFPIGGLTGADTIGGKPSLRGQIRKFFSGYGKGGGWPESSEYNTGTSWLALSGAYYAGLDNFPEAKTWLIERATQFKFELTPDLKDSHQWGDVQNVRTLRLGLDYIDLWTLWHGVLDVIGEKDLADQLRQLEADVYAANNVKAVAPLYARYYYTQNPYGAKAPWRSNGLVQATGIGLGLWREGQTSGLFHCPNWHNGAVDHFQAFGGCDFRIRKDGVWIVDHPIGYAPDQRVMNSVMLNGSGPGQETGGLVASTYIPGKLVYLAGIQAGATTLVYPNYSTHIGTNGDVPYTTTHENMRSLVQLLDGPDLTVIVADRVHADDTKLETITNKYGTFGWTQLYSYANQQNTVNNRLGVTNWIWHTRTQPTRTANAFTADGVTVTRLLPTDVTTTVVNEALDQDDPAAIPYGYCNQSKPKVGCLGGYMSASERKWAIHEVPTTHQAFRLQLRVVSTGAVTSTRIAAPEGEWVRVSRPNLPDVAVFFSSKVGPRLKTSTKLTPSGSSLVTFDPTKLATVSAGRIVTTKAPPPTGTVAYYADMGDELIPADTPPPPTCTFSNVTPTSATVEAAGATVAVSVTKSNPSCEVPVTTPVAWITPSPTATGVSLVVAPNDVTSSRVGQVVIAKVPVVITQNAFVPPVTSPTCIDGGTAYPIGTERTVNVEGNNLESTVDGYQDAGWLVTGVLPSGPNYVVRMICVGS